LAASLAPCVPSLAQTDTTVTVREADPKMLAAMKKAQQTLPQFIKALRSSRGRLSYVYVKYPFVQDMKVEHMWIRNVVIQGDRFVGVLANHPESITNIKAGDTVRVPASSISDWRYVQNGKLVGGFTIRVLRNELTPKERKAFDADLPFKID
jgi:uncharacterized protein YegJ (DUF2314 family)